MYNVWMFLRTESLTGPGPDCGLSRLSGSDPFGLLFPEMNPAIRWSRSEQKSKEKLKAFVVFLLLTCSGSVFLSLSL